MRKPWVLEMKHVIENRKSFTLKFTSANLSYIFMLQCNCFCLKTTFLKNDTVYSCLALMVNFVTIPTFPSFTECIIRKKM